MFKMYSKCFYMISYKVYNKIYFHFILNYELAFDLTIHLQGGEIYWNTELCNVYWSCCYINIEGSYKRTHREHQKMHFRARNSSYSPN